MSPEAGKYIIMLGIIVLLAGVIVYFFHDRLHWIGRLPGDIRFEKGNVRFYFPLATMIVFSVVLTVLVNILKRLF